MDLGVEQTIGQYRLVRPLGQGGAGVVSFFAVFRDDPRYRVRVGRSRD